MAGAEAGGGGYDWNCRPKYYVISGRQVGPNTLIWDADTPPDNPTDIQRFVESNDLNHGDVINFGQDRDSGSQIVCREESSEVYRLVRNPDDSGAGYLTIPAEVLAPVKDALGKYRDVMEHVNNENGLINFHISRSDVFLAAKFPGAPIPDDWQFNVTFKGNSLETFSVKTPTRTWQSFDLDKVTWNDVVDTLRCRSDEDIVRFGVKVTLEGAALEQYKVANRGDGGKYSWISAKPRMPAGWMVEVGASGSGSGYRKWIWKLSGPKSLEGEAKRVVSAFLSGYDFTFVDQNESNIC